MLGSQLSMTFGAIVAAVAGDAFLTNQVGWLGGLASGALVAGLIYALIVVGKLTVTCLNAYGSFMCAATITTALTGRRTMGSNARAAFVLAMLTASMGIALWASADFLDNFKNFVLLLLMVFTPWSAINLTDYYLVSKERVDLPALYDPAGRYGGWNHVALTTYAVGVLIQVPFLAQALYTGPVTEALGGADISWIVGLLVPAAMYYVWASRDPRAPAESVERPTPPSGERATGPGRDALTISTSRRIPSRGRRSTLGPCPARASASSRGSAWTTRGSARARRSDARTSCWRRASGRSAC